MANANSPTKDWIVTVQITKYLDVRAADKERATVLANRLVQGQFGSQDVRITSIQKG